MTIKTLEMIHRLLKDEVENAKDKYLRVKEKLVAEEERGSDYVHELKALLDSTMVERQEAMRALSDFELHSFG
jgi:hypothetical protein